MFLSSVKVPRILIIGCFFQSSFGEIKKFLQLHWYRVLEHILDACLDALESGLDTLGSSLAKEASTY